MILTRCPHCSTAFRVTAEQLKARAGQVRCGRCRGRFNALDALIDTPPLALAVTTTAAPAPEPLHRVVLDSDLTPVAAQAEAESPPAAALVDITEPIPAAQPADVEDGDATARRALAAAEPILRQEPEHVPPSVGAEQASPPVAEPQPLAAADAEADVAPEATTTPLAEILPQVPERRSRRPAVLWGSAAVTALLALSGQAAYVFRGDLALQWPEARPWLEVACARLGCQVPLPSRAELVSVESSELHPDPGNKQRLLLATTLKNRAAFTQAYPHMEITLTDTRDQPVVRRVFEPREYLDADIRTAAGFAPNADLAVNLALETTAHGATGYRLYVFYP